MFRVSRSAVFKSMYSRGHGTLLHVRLSQKRGCNRLRPESMKCPVWQRVVCHARNEQRFPQQMCPPRIDVSRRKSKGPSGSKEYANRYAARLQQATSKRKAHETCTSTESSKSKGTTLMSVAEKQGHRTYIGYYLLFRWTGLSL
jgi:hypothetical protein